VPADPADTITSALLDAIRTGDVHGIECIAAAAVMTLGWDATADLLEAVMVAVGAGLVRV
jgi:hypothetical protein